MKFRLYLILVLLLSGCTSTDAGPEATAVQDQDIRHEIVSEDAAVAFLEILVTRDYHAIRRSGEKIFHEGLYIPNYHRVFRDYPSEDLPNDHIRYDLLIIEGEAGVAWVYLFLEKDSGKIIQFSAGEAIF